MLRHTLQLFGLKGNNPSFIMSFLVTLMCDLQMCRFLVRVSYLEIYNEEVRDLLGKDQTQRLEVHTHTQLYRQH